MTDFDKVNRWLGQVWLCPDCGRVLHKPPQRFLENRYHSVNCKSPMVSVSLDWRA